MYLNMFDYGLLVVILLSLLLGFRRGFFAEVLSVLTWVIAFFVAMLFTHSILGYVAHYVKSEVLAGLISFIGLFVATLIVGAIIRTIVMRFSDSSKMSLANRMLGGIFGIGRGILVALLVVFVFSNTALQKHEWFQQSVLTKELQCTNAWINAKVATVDWGKEKAEVLPKQ